MVLSREIFIYLYSRGLFRFLFCLNFRRLYYINMCDCILVRSKEKKSMSLINCHVTIDIDLNISTFFVLFCYLLKMWKCFLLLVCVSVSMVWRGANKITSCAYEIWKNKKICLQMYNLFVFVFFFDLNIFFMFME